jgi:hypothetical protein
LDAGCPGFLGGYGLGFFREMRVPGGSHRYRGWEDGVVAVDYVESEENRNVQASLFDGNVLEAVDFFGIGHPKDGAGTVLLQNFFHRPAYSLLELIDLDTGELGELGYFFCLGHLM